MAIYKILQNMAFDPERTDALVKAYEDSLRVLQLRDRSDPVTKLIAKTLIDLAQAGERDPDRLRAHALAVLGITPAGMGSIADGAAPLPAGPLRQKLLIVEDDEAFAYAASRHFQSLGYETLVASGSMAAFELLDRDTVDLVIADIRLQAGEPHGVALGRMIRNRDRGMPVVLVTAHPELLEHEKPLPGPAFAKPVDLTLLASAVKAALAT
jgi:DNA-binding NtrC family response regulator